MVCFEKFLVNTSVAKCELRTSSTLRLFFYFLIYSLHFTHSIKNIVKIGWSVAESNYLYTIYCLISCIYPGPGEHTNRPRKYRGKSVVVNDTICPLFPPKCPRNEHFVLFLRSKEIKKLLQSYGEM